MKEIPAERFPLSVGQQAIWIGHHLDETGCAYNIAGFLAFDGNVRTDWLATAVKQVGAETEALRLRFEETWSGVEQWVSSEFANELVVVDFSMEDSPEDAALDWMRENLRGSPDLRTGDLSTFALLKVGDERSFFYQRLHHVAMDAFAGLMVSQRLAERYTALSRGNDWKGPMFGSLHALVREESEYRDSPQFVRDREYWAKQFDGWSEHERSPHRTAIPTDSASTRNSAGYLSKCTSDLVFTRANELNLPWWVLIIAATAAYLRKSSGTDDIVVMMPVHGRLTPSARSTPAMVSNILPIRLDVQESLSFENLARNTSLQVTGALKHQRYRFEDIRRDLGHRRDPGGWWPLVNPMNFDYGRTFSDLISTTNPLAVGPSYDMSFSLYGRLNDGDLRIDLDASERNFSEKDLSIRHSEYLNLLSVVIENPELAVGFALRDK